MPLSPPAAKLRDFIIDEMKGKNARHATNA
jgi:hypothetical protein